MIRVVIGTVLFIAALYAMGYFVKNVFDYFRNWKRESKDDKNEVHP